MSITLKRAQLSDAEAMHMMQVTAFLPLLEKYHDTAINPACETVERVREKITHSRCYFIMEDGRAVGGIRVVQGPSTGGSKVISPLFVLAGYRGRGVAQRAVKLVESIHGADGWKLNTILEEPGNCHLYEKIGYRKTGKTETVNDKMTLVYYEKRSENG